MNFKVGDRVYHRAMNACGTVDGIDADGAVHVTFPRTKNLGTVRGVYDKLWFDLYPRELVLAPQGQS